MTSYQFNIIKDLCNDFQDLIENKNYNCQYKNIDISYAEFDEEDNACRFVAVYEQDSEILIEIYQSDDFNKSLAEIKQINCFNPANKLIH